MPFHKPLLLISTFIIIGLFSCKKETTPVMPSSYLDAWCGTYSGTSHFWTTYPKNGQMSTSRWEKAVTVDVQRGSKDSTLNFLFTYNDTVFVARNDLPISNDYTYFDAWGGGSSYGSLHIQFKSDSILSYNLFQKCGIPCSSGEDFEISRK